MLILFLTWSFELFANHYIYFCNVLLIHAYHSIMWMYHNLFANPVGQLSSFWFFNIISNGAIDILITNSFHTSSIVLLDELLGAELLNHPLLSNPSSSSHTLCLRVYLYDIVFF